MKLNWQTVQPEGLVGDTWESAIIEATDRKGNVYRILGEYLIVRNAQGERLFGAAYRDVGPAKAAATRYAKKVAGEQTIALKLSVSEWKQLEDLLATHIAGKRGKAFDLYCKLSKQAETQQV